MFGVGSVVCHNTCKGRWKVEKYPRGWAWGAWSPPKFEGGLGEGAKGRKANSSQSVPRKGSKGCKLMPTGRVPHKGSKGHTC